MGYASTSVLVWGIDLKDEEAEKIYSLLYKPYEEEDDPGDQT